MPWRNPDFVPAPHSPAPRPAVQDGCSESLQDRHARTFHGGTTFVSLSRGEAGGAGASSPLLSRRRSFFHRPAESLFSEGSRNAPVGGENREWRGAGGVRGETTATAHAQGCHADDALRSFEMFPRYLAGCDGGRGAAMETPGTLETHTGFDKGSSCVCCVSKTRTSLARTKRPHSLSRRRSWWLPPEESARRLACGSPLASEGGKGRDFAGSALAGAVGVLPTRDVGRVCNGGVARGGSSSIATQGSLSWAFWSGRSIGRCKLGSAPLILRCDAPELDPCSPPECGTYPSPFALGSGRHEPLVAC